jgi:predicted RNase H-like nuclease (RuvC/YqgF family)
MNKFIFRISLIAAYFAIVLSLISCQTERKATRFMSEHPNILAKICDEKFPVIPSVDTFVTIDSAILLQYEREFSNLYYLIDSLISNDSIKTVIQTQFKTVSKPIYKTKTVTITKENTARLAACKEQIEENERDYELNIKGFQTELDEADKQIQELKDKVNRTRKQRNKFMWLLIGMSIFAFRRQILKLLI